MYYPNFETFEKLSCEGNLIPVYREVLADMETPVSVLMKLRSREGAFLLESVEGGEKWGRYTFLGSDPKVVLKVRGDEVIIKENGKSLHYKHKGDPLRFLRELMGRYRPATVEGCPRFYGGAVGFLGYDMAWYFERLPVSAAADLKTDDATFLLTDTMFIFDNVRHTIKVVACAVTGDNDDLGSVYGDCMARIDEMAALLNGPSEESEKQARLPERGEEA
ncbi:MAG TPA: anthranilate synthase component I, partial [Syntrophales bacterium]|nr:anthranilate synthase component I [Syntrophales bacterium]